ncbi:hypothetical protein V2J09_024275 [Rumex salicifolius]
MDQQDEEPANLSLQIVNPSRSVLNSAKLYRLVNGSAPAEAAVPPMQSPVACLEARLFYVRISPCAADLVPENLALRFVRREIGVSLEINGSRVPASVPAESTLRRDRVDREAAEVTYVSTDNVRVSGGCVEFEVYDRDNMILCGSMDRLKSDWGCNGNVSSLLENDSKTGWNLDCYMAASVGSSAFFQPKLAVTSPSMEVYIAGCCSGVPVILTRTISLSPRRKQSRHSTLDAIPEEEEIGKQTKIENEFLRQRKLQLANVNGDGYADPKFGQSLYSEEMYPGEDGELSWFNAGVRVGVGIGLGMCLGVGIGVGLMMRSYQATTRNFRRRFL